MKEDASGLEPVEVVVAEDEGDDIVRAVIELGDSHRETLGFLPESVTRDYAARGQVLAAVDGDALLGFATFALPADRVRLVQLCVAPPARERGIARLLVESIAERHPHRTEIRLRCRRDFPAHDMWPQLGFTPMGDVVGRSAAEHVLTEWRRPIHQALTLFDHVSSASGDRDVTAVVDVNVFLDLIRFERSVVESEALNQTWVHDELTLVYSDELLREVDRHEDPRAREEARAAALARFRRLGADHYEVDRCVSFIEERLGPARDRRARSDRRQIAHAEAGGADYLVTRDDELLTNVRRKLAGDLHVQIRSPAELIVEIGSPEDELVYAPARLLGTSLETRHIKADDLAAVGAALVNHAVGETRTQLTQRIRDLLSDHEQWKARVVSHDQEPVGLVVWRGSEKLDEVALLRTRSGWHLSATLARELLAARRRERARGGGGLVRLTDSIPSQAVEAALRSEGFVTRKDGNICRVLSGIAAPQAWEPAAASRLPASEHEDLRAAIGQLGDPRADAEFERALWPAKVAGSRLPTYLVPIAPAFAADLFDDELAAQTLFDRPDRVGIARENVYYRAPQGPRLQAPARILWYVSSEHMRPGVQAVRAVSRLESVTVSAPDRVHQRFEHIGAYTLEQVREAAKPNNVPPRKQRVMAIRFSLTEQLPKPVGLPRFRELANAVDHSLMLQSVSAVPTELFDAVYREATTA